jgi:hypothetical protein
MNPETVVRGDSVTLKYQLKEDDVAKDITGMTFKFAVKENITDTTQKIGPVDGTIDDAAGGRFSFELTAAMTDQAPFAGRAEIAMYDSQSRKITLSPPAGLEFRLVEDIIE